MHVCHLDKVDQIRDHVRQLIAPKKLESQEKRTKELDHKETHGTAIELEPVGSEVAGQVREHLASSPEKPLLV